MLERSVAALLLVFFFASGTVSLLGKSATFDETAHLPAGVSYWQTGDFRLNPEHPPLAKLWCALPVVALDLLATNYGSTAWTGSQRLDDGRTTGASEWEFGYEALNGPPSSIQRRDPRPALAAGRVAMMALAVLLGFLVWRRSRSIWGTAGGLISLAMYCLSPTILGHARWVTTDLPAALGLFALVAAVSSWAERPGLRRVPGVAAAAVLLLAVKFSAVLLVPVAILIALPLAWLANEDCRPRIFRAWLSLVGLSAVTALLGLWAVYGFRFAASSTGYAFDWGIIGSANARWTGDDLAWRARWVHMLLDWKVLPESYLYGLAYVVGGASRRLAYLNGAFSDTGWWAYFPQAFLMKSTPAELALFGWGLVRVLRLRRIRSPAIAIPVAVIAIYLALSVGSSLNIGHRHLLPIYPLLFLLAGALGTSFSEKPISSAWTGAPGRPRWILVGLLTGCAISFGVATPHYLSYFNFTAGGPNGGWRYLLDSNLDWGQDLPALKSWMDREGIGSIHLAYFGTAEPAIYGIESRKILRVHDFDRRSPAEGFPPSGSLIAVSANFLGGLYLETDRDVAERVVARQWLRPASLQAWLALRQQNSSVGISTPPLLDWLTDERLISTAQADALRSELIATKMEQLRTVDPFARPAPSILVFRVP